MRSTLVNNRSGFTLVEVMVIAPLVILVIGTFVGLMVKLTGDALVNRDTNVSIYETQAGLDTIEQDVRLSTEFRKLSYTPLSPQGVNNTGTAFNALTPNNTASTIQNPLLILRTLTTDKNPVDSSRNIVFKKNSPSDTCAGATWTDHIPYTVDIVYYATYDTPTSRTLWRRVLLDSVSTPCATPWQLPSCYPDKTGAICKGEDEKVATNISDITRYYYATPAVAGSSTGVNAINTNKSDPYDTSGANARCVDIYLTISKQTAGRDTSFSQALRAVRINSSTE